ncbi:MAG: hypothetical protein M5U28_43640 [Sandaracinaceae bacterium]|nr:hypothetical protein [Sandaracinaceae bacterium]
MQSNFIVRYRGRVAHPGQLFMREENDDTDLSALWVFLGDNVETGGISQVFLEVHPFTSADTTCDVCPGSCFSASCPGGTVPSTPGEVEIEIMIIWCGGRASSRPHRRSASTRTAARGCSCATPRRDPRWARATSHPPSDVLFLPAGAHRTTIPASRGAGSLRAHDVLDRPCAEDGRSRSPC